MSPLAREEWSSMFHESVCEFFWSMLSFIVILVIACKFNLIRLKYKHVVDYENIMVQSMQLVYLTTFGEHQLHVLNLMHVSKECYFILACR